MELKDTPLCEALGVTPSLQLLSFFNAHPYYDYSKTELSKFTNLSRHTIYKGLEPLVKFSMVAESRRIGNTKLYKLNNESDTTRMMKGFNNSIVAIIADREIQQMEQEGGM